MESGPREYCLGVALGAAFGLAVGVVGMKATQDYYLNLNNKNRLKQTYKTPDLNNDGKNDSIAERVNGRKSPYFGIEENGKTIYISKIEMKKRYPNSIINYDAIEARLNE